ncbi:MAG TPA: AmmeMemoRadiSam system radical SAM enzyme [Treponemataceae bacterium]|nr:AmmeMemoRadiSam system radical SAM enzyme [Treponemataceae bacterium]
MNGDSAHRSCSWQETLPDGTVECSLCPRRCRIPPGSAGFCGVRFNRSGDLEPLGYGRVSALALDPIEKKPLARFYPGSKILSAGSWGCNLECRFCQNHAISREWIEAQEDEGSAAPIIPGSTRLSPGDLVSEALALQSRGNIGLAFTYNEPVVNFEYVRDSAILAREKGLQVVLVTNGYINPEPLAEILPLVDAMNIDLKAFSDSFYRFICRGALSPVKKTIEAVARSSPRCHLELTTLVIPGHNSDPEEIRALSAWVASLGSGIPLHLNRHHPDWKMAAPGSIEAPALMALADIARENLRYVYCGNI